MRNITEYYNETLFLWEANNFFDSSKNNFEIVNIDNNVIIDDNGKFDKCGYFNGSNAYLVINELTPYTLDSQFTIDCWVNSLALVNGTCIACGNINGSLQFGLNGANLGLAAVGVAWDITTTYQIPLNQWVHLAVTRDSNNVIRMFADGIKIGENTTTRAYTLSNLIIGNNTVNNYFNGYIDELRIIQGVAVWTEDFTPPTSPYLEEPIKIPVPQIDEHTLLNLHFDNDFVDSSQYNRTVISTGATFSDISHFGMYSAGGFDAKKGIEIEDSSDFNFGSNDFTIDCWLMIKSLNSTYQPIFDRRGTVNFTGFIIYIETNNLLYFVTGNGSSGWNVNINSGDLTKYVGKYIHLAVVRNGNVFTMYINGIMVSSATNASSITDITDVNLMIGVGNTNITSGVTNDTFFNGYIDEFRISNIARWTTNFAPPIQPYGGQLPVKYPYNTANYLYGTFSSRYQWYVQWYKYPANTSTITSETYLTINNVRPNGDNVDLSLTVHSTNNITRVSEASYAGYACPTFTYKSQPIVNIHNEILNKDILAYNMELSTDVIGNPSGNTSPTYGVIVHDQTVDVSIPKDWFSEYENIWTFKVQDVITIVNTGATQTNTQDNRVFKIPKLFSITVKKDGKLYQSKNVTIMKNGELIDVVGLGVRKDGAIF